MNKIVIFASGSGSNAEKIILHFKNNSSVNVAGIFSNNLRAKVLERAAAHDVPTFVFNKEELNTGEVLRQLNEIQPDLIVLAGFLLKFPEDIIHAYPNMVINIHPALLPKYGGKGMYGMHVHQAVLDNNEKETGITIHYVNEHYDEGAIIAQHFVNIENCTSAEEIAQKVHELEHVYFPITIEKLITHNL
ncbi:phosphoribosylglycinamide formyltransferase [Flavobacterium sp. H122]|uniref:phosphoribosylglycinamide formyltransferase n=1 Tax=Flavobacterium sp. H122 TaxID=2529860 RepID=UPI0010AB42ED|nr:phosphoribosylglycinamide formyltransferase [Flavobacterium sp. H122]